jgi:alpha-N-acetylglucosamine transferase
MRLPARTLTFLALALSAASVLVVAKVSSCYHGAQPQLAFRAVSDFIQRSENGAPAAGRISPLFAYVSYATTDPYFCSALVNFEKLRRLNVSADFVLVITSNFAKHASSLLLAKAKSMNVIVKSVENVADPAGSMTYYHQVFVKFRVFELTYKRVIYFDSDSLFLKVLLSVPFDFF